MLFKGLMVIGEIYTIGILLIVYISKLIYLIKEQGSQIKLSRSYISNISAI